MRFLCIFLVACFSLSAQDSLYTREVIKFLTSKKCNGRGYVNNGLKHASNYLVNEIKKTTAKPFFNASYIQPYNHPVNTFTKKIKLEVNGRKLTPGVDFIVDPESPSLKGTYNFVQKDSATFYALEKNQSLIIKKTKKLTYSVGTKVTDKPIIQLLNTSVSEPITTINISLKSTFIPEFETNNIGAQIDGLINDSIVLFTAHYDHLGAMGKNCYFPGANDNASGTSMLLNLMKYYSVNKPKYKTVFLFFSSEEAGLLGSGYFVKNNSINLAQIKFLINLDLLGTGDDGIMVVNGAIFNNQFQLLEKINTEKNLLKEIKKRGKAMNSDHYWFTEKGVPSFFIYTLGGVSYYHDVYDRAETLPLTKYKQVFTLLTEFAKQLN